MENLFHLLIEIRQEAGLLAATLTAFAIAALRSGIVALLTLMAGIELTAAVLGLTA